MHNYPNIMQLSKFHNSSIMPSSHWQQGYKWSVFSLHTQARQLEDERELGELDNTHTDKENVLKLELQEKAASFKRKSVENKVICMDAS